MDYSAVRTWERLRAAGRCTSQSAGRREKGRVALLADDKQLRRRIEVLEKRLAKTELVVDLQKTLGADGDPQVRRHERRRMIAQHRTQVGTRALCEVLDRVGKADVVTEGTANS